uniref:Uncharacterized protein n=1 Tax=Arundo donax TaxID=35708 RepID=A0A0A8ZWD9_ARUDO
MKETNQLSVSFQRIIVYSKISKKATWSTISFYTLQI